MKLTREVKTGLIAVFVLAFSVWGFNFLKGKNIISPTDSFYVEYSNIEGLIESGAVFYHGFKVGSINSIDFNPERKNPFIVKIVLEKDVKIPLKTQVVAKASNPIAGAKDLQLIIYDTNAYHIPGDTLLPAYDPGMLGMLDPIKEQFEGLTTELNKSLLAVNNILNDDAQKDLQASLNSINKIAYSLSQLLASNGDLAKTIGHLEQVSASIENKKEDIEETVEHMSNITASLDNADLQKTIMTLDSTLMATHEILSKINESEGTMGLLVNDSALYMNLAASTASLDSLFIDLKDHPKKYVHFSLFGKKEK